MFGMGMPELIVVLVIVLIIFGPSKLPDIAKGLGKSIAEFKKGMHEAEVELKKPANEDPTKKA